MQSFRHVQKAIRPRLFHSFYAGLVPVEPQKLKCDSQNYSKWPIMTLPKGLRHAQTQHGDESVDVENIFLHRAMLCVSAATSEETAAIEKKTENAETATQADIGSTSQASEIDEKPLSPQCTWFYEVEPPTGSTAEQKLPSPTAATDAEKTIRIQLPEKRKAESREQVFDLKKAKLETKALKAKRPGFTDERYQETSYYIDNGLRKVYPYFFTFTTFTKGRWVNEKILEVFSREFRAHPAEEYERCIEAGTLTVNYEKVPIDYRLKHNDLLANIVHRHEVPVTSQPITVVHMDEDIVVVNKPASIPVHPCGRYRHNTVVFILAKEFNLKNLRTIHRLDRLTSGLLLFGRTPKKARQMEQQIRNREVQKEYVCRVEGVFPDGVIECQESIEVVSYKIGVCKVSPKGKDCKTTFQKIAQAGDCSIVLCKPLTGRMHQIRVHLQYLGYPIVNDPLYNHVVFGPLKGRGGDIGGKTDAELINDLINIHNAENWLGIDGDADVSLFTTLKDKDSLKPRQSNDNETSPKQNSSNGECDDTSEDTPIESEPEPTPAIISISSNKTDVTVSTQTGHEAPDIVFDSDKVGTDPHCYECKVNYRDPKPLDLIMYLHAWKYKGPGWAYETDLPDWASPSWVEEK